MGNFISYPLKAETLSYHRRQDYNAYGEKRTDVTRDVNEIDLLHRKHCAEIFAQRRNNNFRRTLLAVSDEEYSKKFPHWSPEEIGDYKIQFGILDLNRDGVIDYNEMNSVLDEFGEPSNPDDRWRCFNEMMDADHSGTIDFEEFLVVITRLQRSEKKTVADENIINIVSQGANQVAKLRRMSVRRQMENGLF